MGVRLELGPQQLDGLVVEVDKTLQVVLLVELDVLVLWFLFLLAILLNVLSCQEGVRVARAAPGADAALLLKDTVLCPRRRIQCLLNCLAPVSPGRVLVDARKFQFVLNSIVNRQALVRSGHTPSAGRGGRH